MLIRCDILMAGIFLSSALVAQAGTFSSDFNTTNTPAGTLLYGNAVIESTGGVGNSGVLKLTKAINSQSSSFVIDDLDGGNLIYGFDVAFKVRLGGGTATPADGFSVNFAPNIPNGTFSEEGTGSGLSFTFDIYDNGSETPPAPSIDVKVGGQFVATRHLTIAQITTDTNFADVHIQVNPDGSLNMAYQGAVLFTNFFLPNYQPLAGRFGIGGRTGGANENQWIDNLQITTYLQPKIGISLPLFSQKVLTGQSAWFNVEITNPDGATFQWFKNGVAITGATAQSLSVSNVAGTDSGSKYKVTVKGPNNTITSDEVTLTVVNLVLPATPKLSFNFDDGAVPPGTQVVGTALVDAAGGVNNSGSLKLTINANNQSGAFIIADADSGAPVYGFTARFKVLVGGGTTPPADGFSFSFGNDIPDNPTGAFEEGQGTGTGLRVSFDIYNNAPIFGISPSAEVTPAPSIDIRYGSQLLASAALPLSFLETVDTYQDVIIRLDTDGTVSVAYRGLLIHDHVPVPGFASLAGGRFALGVRTGGLNENQWVDNLQITTDLNAGNLRIATQPATQTVLVSKSATFSVVLNDPAGATFQWLRDGVAISGATANTYTLATAAVADSGAKFTVKITKSNLTVTSDAAVLTVLNLAVPTSPTVTFNFDNGQVPAGTSVYGNAAVAPNGGVNDSGVLQLTVNQNSQSGAFVIQPLLGGAELSGFTAAFDVLVGGGTTPPADGFSFNFAPDLANATVGGAEDGSGTGLTIGFDIYNNGNETPPAPSIDVRYKGAVVASTQLPFTQIETGSAYRKVLVRLGPDGKLDLAFGDLVLYNGLQLTNYTFMASGKLGFYARTGGLNENQWVDNLVIAATKSALPLRISQDPADAAVLIGKAATFSVALSDPTGATYQWSKNGVAIPGATSASYTTPVASLADNGTKFSVQATGPGGTVKSRDALLSVLSPITVSNPIVSFDFNDGQLPPGTSLNSGAGGGYVDVAGGVGNSGVLKLTDAVNGQAGTFIIADGNNSQPVSAFVAHFSVRVGGGTVPPADGFSFVWANDLNPNATFGEDGSGSGLTVSFDIYDNGGGEAPAFNITYKTQAVATNKVAISVLETGDAFVDVYIHVKPNGTLDVLYNGNVIFNSVPLPGFSPMTGGAFAWGARTGGLNENQWVDNIQIALETAPPAISWARAGNNLSLTWGPGFKLQSTANLEIPITWSDVPGATSPYIVTPANVSQFYRLAP